MNVVDMFRWLEWRWMSRSLAGSYFRGIVLDASTEGEIVAMMFTLRNGVFG